MRSARIGHKHLGCRCRVKSLRSGPLVFHKVLGDVGFIATGVGRQDWLTDHQVLEVEDVAKGQRDGDEGEVTRGIEDIGRAKHSLEEVSGRASVEHRRRPLGAIPVFVLQKN